MRRTVLTLLLLTASVAPSLAAPLGLAWGVVSEPAVAGAMAPGRVAEHIEFLQAHGWTAIRLRALGREDLPEHAAVLSFDDPASAARYVLPLLELYDMPAVVTVGLEQGRDATLAPALAALARSPWIELVPRVDAPRGPANSDELRCAPPAPASASEEPSLTALRAALAAQVDLLRRVTGVPPSAVAWAPGTWSGPGEKVAASLGLTVQLPTFDTMPPQLAGFRVARYAMPSWAGIWAIAQTAVRWDPAQHPVRFVEVDAGWVCAGGDPQARLQRILAVVRQLGLNGVRLLPGDGGGAWFPTAAAPMLGDVVGPLARALHAAGVSWVAVDVPATGDSGRDVALSSDLARAVDIDVAVLPPGADDRLGEAIQYVRPAARLAWRSGDGGQRAFRLAPFAPEQATQRGATVTASDVGGANREATHLAVGGWEWLGLPVELAERGLHGSLRSLAAFALPTADPRANR
jgi:peptidoglycan/xylan/chitin deacetylase (PgdA/CDA1 family)